MKGRRHYPDRSKCLLHETIKVPADTVLKGKNKARIEELERKTGMKAYVKSRVTINPKSKRVEVSVPSVVIEPKS